jgi:hypothetical protein
VLSFRTRGVLFAPRAKSEHARARPNERRACRDTMPQHTPFNTRTRNAVRWAAGALGAAAGAYLTYAGVTWLRYGQPAPANPEEIDPLLDQFMPVSDVVERHHIQVAAPADVTFAAACDIDLQHASVVRAIFRAREVLLGSEPDPAARPRGLLAFTRSLGWGTLAEVPTREVVMGAVTQPWEANPVFRPVPPDAFATFNEPGYVKIVWTLRAEPVSAIESVFRTETRAVATDPTARAKFRRYWSFLSPGIIGIRWMMLQPLKAEAQRRAAARQLADRETGAATRPALPQHVPVRP